MVMPMLRILFTTTAVLFLLALGTSHAQADWVNYGGYQQVIYDHENLVSDLDCGPWLNDSKHHPGKPKYASYFSEPYGSSATKYFCHVYYWRDLGSSPVPSPDDMPSDPVYFMTYTDEQCESSFGGSQTFQTTVDQAEAGFTTAGGACGIAAISSSIACWDSQDGNSYCNAEWVSVSSGNPATPDTDGSSGTVSDFVPPDYMTPVDSNDGICATGACVTIDGQTYHVDQSAIDNGSVTIVDLDGSGGGDTGSGDSGGIDWGDDSPTSTPGTSTDPDGNPLGMGGGDPDGDGEGDSTLGDVVGAINGLKTTVRNGFDGILEKSREYMDGLVQAIADNGPEGENIEDVGTEEENLTKATTALDEVKEELISRIDGTDSDFGSLYATMQGYWDSFFPSIPSPSCSPLVFAPSTPYSFTVECDVFNMIREALAWILYALTLYVVITSMFSARPS